MCSSQDVGGEVWAYQEPVAVFVEDKLLLGGLPELLTWAADSYCYHDNLSLADYEAVAIAAYNDHISRSEVIIYNCHSLCDIQVNE